MWYLKTFKMNPFVSQSNTLCIPSCCTHETVLVSWNTDPLEPDDTIVFNQSAVSGWSPLVLDADITDSGPLVAGTALASFFAVDASTGIVTYTGKTRTFIIDARVVVVDGGEITRPISIATTVNSTALPLSAITLFLREAPSAPDNLSYQFITIPVKVSLSSGDKVSFSYWTSTTSPSTDITSYQFQFTEY